MGGAPFLEQREQQTYQGLVKGKIALLLEIKGHRHDDKNRKTAKFVPLQSGDETNIELISRQVKGYEYHGNVFESLELYSLSLNPAPVPEILENLKKYIRT